MTYYNLLKWTKQKTTAWNDRLSTALFRISFYRNSIINQFHKLFFDGAETDKPWSQLAWLGTATLKCPCDLWIYQEILVETRPDLIVECGTYMGGTAHYLASLCDLLHCGRVITIDVEVQDSRPPHPRITYLLGSSISPLIVNQVSTAIKPGERVMVILDSDHHYDHVLQELTIYSKIVTSGCYLVVEDTVVNGHPILSDHGPGPMEAVTKFLETNHQYVPDHNREKLILTFNPGGYLKRIA